MPPLLLTWYDGGLKPAQPSELEPGRAMGDVIYIGEKGKMMGYRLIPESRMKEYGRPPKVLPRSPGHFKEWVDACRGGPAAGANFVDHAGLHERGLRPGERGGPGSQEDPVGRQSVQDHQRSEGE